MLSGKAGSTFSLLYLPKVLEKPDKCSDMIGGYAMKLVYPAIFTPCEELTGYTVTIPDLPGCITEGRNLAEAIEMGIDAASGWILDEIEDGNSYPDTSRMQDISVPDGSFINLLMLDPEIIT